MIWIQCGFGFESVLMWALLGVGRGCERVGAGEGVGLGEGVGVEAVTGEDVGVYVGVAVGVDVAVGVGAGGGTDCGKCVTGIISDKYVY